MCRKDTGALGTTMGCSQDQFSGDPITWPQRFVERHEQGIENFDQGSRIKGY